MTIWNIPPGKELRDELAEQIKDQLLYPDDATTSFLNVLYDVREIILQCADQPDREAMAFLETKKSMVDAARHGSVAWDPPIQDLAKAIFTSARRQ